MIFLGGASAANILVSPLGVGTQYMVRDFFNFVINFFNISDIGSPLYN